MDRPYRLEDMAADAAGLLGHLGLESAHVAGVSMGGMLAQALAYEHPSRVRSLVSIMSTTGERGVSEPTAEAREILMRPRATTVGEAQESAVESARVIGSPGLVDEERVRLLARTAFERASDPDGYKRQLDSIYAARDRSERVREISAPTLVIHGELDPLIPVSAGRATAAAIDGAELVVIEGMGHDMPPPLWPRLADLIATHVARNC
jgi:pimeloyl-ACP methyl ester carboxylesterase